MDIDVAKDDGVSTKRKQTGVAQMLESWELQSTVEKTLEYLISFPPAQFSKWKPGVHCVYELGERVKNKVASLLTTEQV